MQESAPSKVLLVSSLRRKKGMYFINADDSQLDVKIQPIVEAKRKKEKTMAAKAKRREAQEARFEQSKKKEGDDSKKTDDKKEEHKQMRCDRNRVNL